MLFNSLVFIVAFLPTVWLVHRLLTGAVRSDAARLWLVAASLFFYGWWNPVYLPLIAGSMAVNFAVGRRLVRHAERPGRTGRALLAAGVAFNLTLLGWFKYAGFVAVNLNRLLDSPLAVPDVTLPLAISFFTFQQIAFLVDSARGETHAVGAADYVLFVTFFPQLIAGPIVHHREMMPQFRLRLVTDERGRLIALGLVVFSLGLFKKIVLADSFAVWATAGFDHATRLNLVEAWAASLSYTFQLWLDFAGYTDMAIGAALLFGIRLPQNFDAPYRSLSIQDFWRRWHVTLSRFLREYLYIPLGGNRHGEARTAFALFLTFLLGGLWHGASWMFVIWGALHGIAIVAHRQWRRAGMRMPRPLAWVATFGFVSVAWVFFRAADMPSAV